MSVETMEANGTQVEENQNKSGEEHGQTQNDQEKEITALSVNEPKKKYAQGLQLATNSVGGLPGKRPVEASHLQIVNTYSSVGGNRPVVKSGIKIKGMLTISGNRPITASHLKISETYTVMGNRPVAPNEIDDPISLMGFID